MNNEQFQRAQQDMNTEQRQIFNAITESIARQCNGEQQRERIFITGGAGTGKTFLLKLLKNQVNQCYGRSVVKVGAPTGVAAKLAGGSTLNCLLNLPLQIDGVIDNRPPPMNDDYLRVMREDGQWQDVEFLFIDNISVVSYQMLCMIDYRLQELKSNRDFFGGINVLLFGDLMQLPPVQGGQIFQHPLWRLFRKIELQQNMRQQGDPMFIGILNALRVGELTSKHLSILEGKVSTDATDEFSIKTVIRIYPTNKLVDEHNQKVLQHFQREGRTIYTITAQDVAHLVDDTQNLGNTNLDSIIPDNINKTGELPKVLNVFEGAKVMLRSNINIEKGLINGSTGFITQIIWPFFDRDQMYDYDKHIPSVCVDFGPEFGVHVIEPIVRRFPAKYNAYGINECSRRMLPIQVNFACTVHRVQGRTIDKAVVYLGSQLFVKGQSYVALSCVKSLDGLQIEELDRSKLMGEDMCNIDALSELRRLRMNN